MQARRDAAIALAREAGALAQRMRPGLGSPTLKGAQDWLTEADGAVERLVGERLAALFPTDGLLGEEGAQRPGSPVWVVDPIDGTSNFSRGGGRWAVSLGLVADGVPVLGVIHVPDLDETYAAVAGGPATLNGVPIRAAPTASLARAIIEVGWSPRRPSEGHRRLYLGLQEAGAMLRNSGSAAVSLAEIAAGRLDGYAELHVNSWDCAAGLAILEASGARVPPLPADWLTAGLPILVAAPGLAAEMGEVTGLP